MLTKMHVSRGQRFEANETPLFTFMDANGVEEAFSLPYFGTVTHVYARQGEILSEQIEIIKVVRDAVQPEPDRMAAPQPVPEPTPPPAAAPRSDPKPKNLRLNICAKGHL